MSDPLLAVAVVAWIVGFGLVAARMANGLERSEAVWFTIGAILGPAALLILRKAPPSRCRTCGASTPGWTYICWWCREDVRLPNASVAAVEARLSGRHVDVALLAPVDRRGAPDAAPLADDATNHQPQRAREARNPKPVVAPMRDAPVARLAATMTQSRRRQPEAPERVDTPPSIAARTMHPAREGLPESIATAVFVVGSARLDPGRRYSFAIRSNRLLVLGPIDVDPSTVALDRPIAEIEVHAVDERLVISEPRAGSGLALAFMAVTGATTDEIAALITAAASEVSGSPGRNGSDIT